ncbi:MAG: SDR family oxidoreductase [Clostridia bacterium]|nr:SDR family oxidoreductase [Clostridia bacterium]
MKVALITGASGAIGGALVKKFVENGYFVVGGYNRGTEEIKSLENRYKGVFFGVRADLNDVNETQALYDFTEKNFGHADVFIANAGVDLYKLLTDTAAEEWDGVFNVNVRSAFILSKACIPEMVRRGRGKILFVSSVWGKTGGSMETAYSASKAALIGLCRALAKEVSPSGINVNCVCPGVIDTKMNARFSEKEITELAQRTPVGRLGTAEEVAELCFYLCSEKADFITGQAYSVDGGFGL